MLNKKDNLIIFVLALLVISLAVFIITKDIDLNKNKNQNNNKNIYVSEEQKDNRYELINKNTNKNTNINVKDKYKGELTKEANGWKKYRNEYWGVEFRFRDEDDGIKVQGGQSGISLSNANVEFGSKDFPAIYIYIDFYENDFEFNGKQYNNIKKYLEAGAWERHYAQISANLISIKNIINNNGLNLVEVIVNATSMDGKSQHKSKVYYIEHNQIDRDKNFIIIHYVHFDISNDLIDTFKFIN